MVYGYLYAGIEAPEQIPVRWNALTTTATKLELLGTVFVDYRLTPLAMNRAALRLLLGVVAAYKPYVLVPGARHLSRWPHERAALIARFQSLAKFKSTPDIDYFSDPPDASRFKFHSITP